MHTEANTHDLIITGIHMDLTESLKQLVREKVEKLFRHEERIIRVKVELEYEQGKGGSEHMFIAKGHIVMNGPLLNVSVTDRDCHKAIDLLVDKLDRMLRRKSRLKRVKRKNTHQVDIPADLPKVAAGE
ncbi:ribosome-associated translation inhibitor RaiA [Puniceicoccaceae bacterium K14]|nr:ribosome-associated translation inhibitor RaiA [Puniceicoccaceae bacterium K14]